MHTAVGASRRHVSAVSVVVVAAALVGAAAVAFLLAVLLGGAEESEGASGHWVVFVRGVDFLFRA